MPQYQGNVSRVASIALAGALTSAAKVDAQISLEKPSSPSITQPLGEALGDLSAPLVGPGRELLSTSPAVMAEVASERKTPSLSDPEAARAQTQNNPTQSYGTLLASLAALVAYGWFYRQLKDGKQPGNLPAAIMYVANDSTLLVAALLTPKQG